MWVLSKTSAGNQQASPMVRPIWMLDRSALSRPLLGRRRLIDQIFQDGVITRADVSRARGSEPFESYPAAAELALRKSFAFQYCDLVHQTVRIVNNPVQARFPQPTDQDDISCS